MRMKFTIALAFIASMTIFSCSKDKNTDPDPEEDQSGALIAKMTQGLRPEDDTVFVFNYDAQKHITRIINVTDSDTFNAVFNTAGLISSVALSDGFTYGTFTYNANNQLIQGDFTGGTFKYRYTFEYTNGIVSKKNYFTASSAGELKLFSYTVYQVTNGNITGAKEYGSDGSSVRDYTFTFNDEPNIFQPMCLLNWMNYLGAEDIAGIEKFFNKNLITGMTYTSSPSSVNVTYTYTYNDKKQLSKVVVSSPSYTDTRQFAY